MFGKPSKTKYPAAQPTLIWDGKCGFCKYWVRYWKSITKDVVIYVPYQNLENHCCGDIDQRNFREAAHLILPDGTIYSGPAAAYKSLDLVGAIQWPQKLYDKTKLFREVSDRSYQFIALHRSLFFKLTIIFFGKNPNNLRPYWLFYLLVLLLIIFLP